MSSQESPNIFFISSRGGIRKFAIGENWVRHATAETPGEIPEVRCNTVYKNFR